MKSHSNKNQMNNSRSVAQAVAKSRSFDSGPIQFVDNRPKTFTPNSTLQQGGTTSGAFQPVQLLANKAVIQRVEIDNIEVTGGQMPQWEQNGLTYHLNVTTDPPHITCENHPKKKGRGTEKRHYFFRRDGDKIISAVSGQSKKEKFSDLPKPVQTFVRNNYMEILNTIRAR